MATPTLVHEDRARSLCLHAEGHLEPHVAFDRSRPVPGTGQDPGAHTSHSSNPAGCPQSMGPGWAPAGRAPDASGPGCPSAHLSPSCPVPRDPDPPPAPLHRVPSSTQERHHESPPPHWPLRPASKIVLVPRPVEMPNRKSHLSHPPLPGMSWWFCIARLPVAAGVTGAESHSTTLPLLPQGPAHFLITTLWQTAQAHRAGVGLGAGGSGLRSFHATAGRLRIKSSTSLPCPALHIPGIRVKETDQLSKTK